ncbi:MAG: glutamine-hydrolyzing GMP synthase [Candidatus Bathyarchaeia archaeon]
MDVSEKSSFDPKSFITERILWLKETIGREKAVVATSGGVDSVTTAVLAHHAIGDRLTVVFLDDGLMRKSEPEHVTDFLKSLGLNVKLLEVSKEFFDGLKGVTDPEEKRKVFRETFYKVLGRAVKDLEAKFLLQGTIAADIVETKGGIKTQHNVLEQIGIDPLERYGYKVLEPLKDLYKPQVRLVAKALGLPRDIYIRKPFPGPGLALRVLGEVTPERVEIVRRATAIVEEETAGMKVFQAFAVLLSDKATGIVGGKRALGDIIAIRIVHSKDAMTATVPRVPWKIIDRIQTRILNENPSVVKILLDLTPKPPSTIEYV